MIWIVHIYKPLSSILFGWVNLLYTEFVKRSWVVVAEIKLEFLLVSSFISLWATVGKNVPRIAINMTAVKCIDSEYNYTKNNVEELFRPCRTYYIVR